MAAAVAVLVSLNGCVSSESTVQSRFAILSEEATAEDRLPVEPNDGAYDAVDGESARYGGEAAGVRLWIAVGTGTSSVCVVVVPENPALTVVGCGGDVMVGRGEEQLKVMPNAGPVVHLLVDGDPQVDTTAWEQVSENLWVE
ncbi:hypothetical protein ACFDTO_07245 [Microbacteriaceae bacterium 4G12]